MLENVCAMLLVPYSKNYVDILCILLGTIGIGGKLAVPLAGLEMGASAEFGGSDEGGLGFKVKGHSKVDNDLLGVHAGLKGGYSAAVKGLGVHGNAEAEGGYVLKII